jgi:hypothetical protein
MPDYELREYTLTWSRYCSRATECLALTFFSSKRRVIESSLTIELLHAVLGGPLTGRLDPRLYAVHKVLLPSEKGRQSVVKSQQASIT